MRLGALVSITLALALLGFPAQATDCETSTSSAVTIPAPTETIYIVVDPSNCPGCPLGAHVFFYEESNGIDGLQRKDSRRDDTCGGKITPDRTWAPG